ncbi:rod shape-determining protein, partial [Agathobacter rectalis]|uniref:rod shape-determining protein n=2 Tax=Agathobacter TaxID=1766253 RepID=UPI0027E9B7E2|nr:rod shape-determining protein [Agathobacter rectalis]
MSNNVYGIDLGTNNFKVYSKATGKTMLEKNTIAVVNKNQIYSYGNSAYAMYEKAPENILVKFPVVEGVIADYNLLQKMIFDFLEHRIKARIKNAEFIIAVPTDITPVEKRAFYEIFYK